LSLIGGNTNGICTLTRFHQNGMPTVLAPEETMDAERNMDRLCVVVHQWRNEHEFSAIQTVWYANEPSQADPSIHSSIHLATTPINPTGGRRLTGCPRNTSRPCFSRSLLSRRCISFDGKAQPLDGRSCNRDPNQETKIFLEKPKNSLASLRSWHILVSCCCCCHRCRRTTRPSPTRACWHVFVLEAPPFLPRIR